jgi:hypothetical protein
MKNIKIYLKGIGTLDVGTKEYGVELHYNISDVRSIVDRKTTYSKKITIPGTKHNNEIFNHLYEIKRTHGNFDIRIKHDCVLYVDTNPIIDGYMFINEIDKIGDEIIYKVTIYDEIISIFNEISGKTLQDLDFSTGFTYNNEVYEIGNHYTSIETSIDSMDNDYKDLYTYSYFNSGYRYNKRDVSQGLLFPHIFHKAIMDKIFDNMGVTYKSDYFSGVTYSGYFSNIVDIYNKENITNTRIGELVEIYGDTVTAGSTGQYIGLETGTTYINGTSVHSVVCTDIVTIDKNGNKGFKIRNPGEYMCYLHIDVSQDWNGYNDPGMTCGYGTKFIIEIWNDNVKQDEHTFQNNWSSSSYTYVLDHKFDITGDYGNDIWILVKVIPGRAGQDDGSGNCLLIPYKVVFNGMSLEVRRDFIDPSTWLDETYVDIGKILPEISQKDFIKSHILQANLYIMKDKITDELIIEPRYDFYRSGKILDWTDKVDLSKPVRIENLNKYMAELMIFDNKEGNDFDSVRNPEYGRMNIYNHNSLLKDKKEYKNNNESYITRLDSENIDPDVPEIRIMDDNEYNETYSPITNAKHTGGMIWGFVDKLYDTSVRVQQYSNTTERNVLKKINITSELKRFGQNGDYSIFPFSNISGNTDTVRGFYSLFWENYINILSSDSSRLVTMYLNLTLDDIINLDLRNRVVIDGQLYYIEKLVTDVSNDNPSKVTLLKHVYPIDDTGLPQPCHGEYKYHFLKYDSTDNDDNIISITNEKVEIN